MRLGEMVGEKRLAHVRAVCQIVRAKKDVRLRAYVFGLLCMLVCVCEWDVCPSCRKEAVKYLFSKTQFLSGFPLLCVCVDCTNAILG